MPIITLYVAVNMVINVINEQEGQNICHLMSAY